MLLSSRIGICHEFLSSMDCEYIYTSYIPISFNFLCLHTAPLWERRTNGLTDRPFPWNNNSLCQFISCLHFVESFAIPACKFSIRIQFRYPYIYIYIYSIKFTWISYLLILFVDPFFHFLFEISYFIILTLIIKRLKYFLKLCKFFIRLQTKDKKEIANNKRENSN